MSDLVALEAAARAATEGPWQFDCGDSSHRYAHVLTMDEETIAYKYGSGTKEAADQDERNYAYIALMHPAQTLALLDHIKRLEAERDLWVGSANDFHARAEKAEAALAKARAAEKAAAENISRT